MTRCVRHHRNFSLSLARNFFLFLAEGSFNSFLEGWNSSCKATPSCPCKLQVLFWWQALMKSNCKYCFAICKTTKHTAYPCNVNPGLPAAAKTTCSHDPACGYLPKSMPMNLTAPELCRSNRWHKQRDFSDRIAEANIKSLNGNNKAHLGHPGHPWNEEHIMLRLPENLDSLRRQSHIVQKALSIRCLFESYLIVDGYPVVICIVYCCFFLWSFDGYLMVLWPIFAAHLDCMLISWWISDGHLPVTSWLFDGCFIASWMFDCDLVVTWRLLDCCLKVVWFLFGGCLMAIRWSFDESLMVVWTLFDG